MPRGPHRRLFQILGIAWLLALNPLPGIVTTDLPDDHIIEPGQGLDGIAKLMIDTSTASFLCSGALLASGRHLVTAAHCVTDPNGMPDLIALAAIFETSDAVSLVAGTEAFVHPLYTGDLRGGHDLAVISLAGPAPAGADRYPIYRGNDELGQLGLMAGYGATGQGKRDLGIPGEIKRAGWNRFEVDGGAFAFPGLDDLLLYDFDNGRAANDGLGLFLGLHDLGEGRREVFPTIGDSGGPTFLGGALAGIHSFGFRLPSDGLNPDVDTEVNQSFGEFAADIRLSPYAGWIDGLLSVPEPPTLVLVLSSLLLLALIAAIGRAKGYRFWPHQPGGGRTHHQPRIK
jgi:hypothetical protein